MEQVSGSYLMANSNIALSSTPASESQLSAWVASIAAALGADVKEFEQSADHYCWRLAIEQQHWLLCYSLICESAWLEPLEKPTDCVRMQLTRQGLAF